MRNNWPILVAALLMASAVSYGLIRHDELREASVVEQPVRTLPAKYVAEASDSVLVAQMPAQTLNQPAAVPALPGIAQPSATRAIGAAPVVPDVSLPALSPGTDYGAALTGVRNALIQRFNVRPYATANGIALTLNGVRVEIESQANWSLTLYNTNAAPNASVQNDMFINVEHVVAGQLDIDLTPQPTIAPDNKHTLKTNSKLGRVAIVTDPALNNSVQIRPLQKRAVPAAAAAAAPAAGRPLPQTIPAPPIPKPAAAGAPAQPVKPVVPAAPPKAPGADQF
jgi:hypothetical protein